MHGDVSSKEAVSFRHGHPSYGDSQEREPKGSTPCRFRRKPRKQPLLLHTYPRKEHKTLKNRMWKPELHEKFKHICPTRAVQLNTGCPCFDIPLVLTGRITENLNPQGTSVIEGLRKTERQSLRQVPVFTVSWNKDKYTSVRAI